MVVCNTFVSLCTLFKASVLNLGMNSGCQDFWQCFSAELSPSSTVNPIYIEYFQCIKYTIAPHMWCPEML